MFEEALLLGITVAGILLAFKQSELPWKAQLKRAPRFDGSVIGGAIVYAVLAAVLQPELDWIGFLVVFAGPILLCQLVLFRQYYYVVDRGDRKSRDLYNAALIIVPIVTALLAGLVSVEYMFLVIFCTLPVGAVSVVLLLYDVIKVVQNDELRLRYVTTSILGILLTICYGFMVIFAAAPTATENGIAN